MRAEAEGCVKYDEELEDAECFTVLRSGKKPERRCLWCGSVPTPLDASDLPNCCQWFTCECCHRPVPWCFGGDGDELCNDCFVEESGAA